MSEVQETLSEMAKDLYSVGGIDKTTLKRFDINSLPPVPNYTATQIAELRHKLGLSQSVFAAYLNVSDRAVKNGSKAKPNRPGQRLNCFLLLKAKGWMWLLK